MRGRLRGVCVPLQRTTTYRSRPTSRSSRPQPSATPLFTALERRSRCCFLLEASPVEGVATNVLGTKCVVDGARSAGVKRFLPLLDGQGREGVDERPRADEGRLREWIVAGAGREPADGRYASVRLGNVVDSAGSIVPVFRRQAARGGPPHGHASDATRHLMTTGEAAVPRDRRRGLADAHDVLLARHVGLGSPPWSSRAASRPPVRRASASSSGPPAGETTFCP